MITETNIKESATIINCDQATIKAVMEVESSGSGFLDDGTPKILFEPHVFWKQLKSLGIDPASLVAKNPTVSDILYPIWGSKPYGKMSAQHARLKRAVEINKEAALKSASWGLFQIMGYNYAATGSCDLQTEASIMTLVPISDPRKRLFKFTCAIAAIDAKASPRNPIVCNEKRSSAFLILEVA